MNVTGHLEELRRRLLWTGSAFLVSFCAAFLYIEPIYRYLARSVAGKLVLLGPADVIGVYCSICGVIALGVTMPAAAYQAWRFVGPALQEHERRAALAYVPAVFVLFAAGIGFGYFIVFPMVLSFLERLAAETFDALFTAEKYFRFLLNMTLPFGLLFEMPAVVLFLTRIGLLNPERLKKARKPAYAVLVVAAVLITPPDFVSDFLVTLPLLLLYEVSVGLSGLIYRKQSRAASSAI